MLTDEELAQTEVDFCIGKCGEGYCNAKSSRRKPGDYPCIEFICAFCNLKTDDNCKFCKGD